MKHLSGPPTWEDIKTLTLEKINDPKAAFLRQLSTHLDQIQHICRSNSAGPGLSQILEQTSRTCVQGTHVSTPPVPRLPLGPTRGPPPFLGPERSPERTGSNLGHLITWEPGESTGGGLPGTGAGKLLLKRIVNTFSFEAIRSLSR